MTVQHKPGRILVDYSHGIERPLFYRICLTCEDTMLGPFQSLAQTQAVSACELCTTKAGDTFKNAFNAHFDKAARALLREKDTQCS